MGPKRRKMEGTCYCRALVRDFEDLLEDLKLDEEYLNYGREMQEKVFDKLKSSGRFKVDRVKVAGSIGKETDLAYDDDEYSDFDLAVFLNDERPPFTSVLKVFARLIGQIRGVKIINITEIAVQLKYSSPSGIIKFDVLPAVNYVKSNELKSGETLAENQGRIALRALRQGFRDQEICPDRNRLYSSSFCEITLDFIHGFVEDKFYRDVTRLAKYWNRQLDLDEYISGRSYMIELIAIACHDPKKEYVCKISGFRRFLEKMADFENIYVDYSSKKVVRDDDFYYRQVKHSDGPIVIDVGNPYNNLAADISESAIDSFMEQAKKTLDVLDEVKSFDGYESYEDVIDEIFSEK